MKNRATATKLNLGAGSGWKPIPGWCMLDHNKGWLKVPQAWDIPYVDKSFDTIFCSHMVEHISHFKIEKVICEMNRTMKLGGVLRLLTPNLRKLAEAYVSGDKVSMDEYIREDDSGIRYPLGLGQAFMSFVVSPGYDNFVFDSELRQFIAGYAHLYSYDFEMMSGLLRHYGFNDVRECDIEDSSIPEHRRLRGGEHDYDKDKRHSLIVECRKERDVVYNPDECLLFGGGLYKVPKIGKRSQRITRVIMGMSGTVESIAYRTARIVYHRFKENRRRAQLVEPIAVDA